MGIKARKIKTMIEEHCDQCITDLNAKLGTSFSFDVDWSVIPEAVGEWNWEDENLKTCFYNSYFLPIEQKFTELFEDSMYKEELSKQIKTIAFVPGKEMVADYEFKDGKFIVKHTMCANQLKPNGLFLDASLGAIEKAIDSQLS